MNAKTKKYTISVMSEDRPGIVASVSGTVFQLEGNILALSQTVVEGYFTIILVAEFPDSVTPELLREKLERSGKQGEYSVIIRNYIKPCLPDDLTHTPHEYVLTARGTDTKGLVYLLSDNLAKRKVNINDIACYLEGNQAIIVAQLLVPHDVDIMCLQDELAAFGMNKNLTIHLQHINIFKETNRI